jgi:hypothetical protein
MASFAKHATDVPTARSDLLCQCGGTCTATIAGSVHNPTVATVDQRLRGGRERVPCAGGVAVCAERLCAHQPRVGLGLVAVVVRVRGHAWAGVNHRPHT